MLRIACILSLVVLCYSCESVVELDIDHANTPLSISGIFTSEPAFYNKSNTFEIQLTQSRTVTSEEDFISIDDALVEIYDRNGLLEILKFNPAVNSSGAYESTQEVEVGKEYALRVIHPDFPTLEATSIVPLPASIGSTTPVSKTGEPSPLFSNTSIEKVELEIEIHDPVETNYYHILFYNNLVDYTIQGLDTFVNWQNANLYGPASFDLEGKNDEYSILSNNSFELYGALLDDKDFKGSSKLLTFTLQYALDPSRHIAEDMLVEVRTVSEEYYDFYTSAIKNADTGANPFSNDPADIRSNIENGFGLLRAILTK